MTRTLSYLVIIAVMISALGSNPTLVGSSLAQPEPSAEPSGTNTTISESLAKLGQTIRPGPNATMSEGPVLPLEQEETISKN